MEINAGSYVYPAGSLIHKNENPLSTYHLLCQSLYSSCFQNGDRLFATYHLIYHLSPPDQSMINKEKSMNLYTAY